jgi:hypothetical protein
MFVTCCRESDISKIKGCPLELIELDLLYYKHWIATALLQSHLQFEGAQYILIYFPYLLKEDCLGLSHAESGDEEGES